MPSKKMRHIETGIGTGRVERFSRLLEAYNIPFTIPNLNTMFIDDKLYFYPTKLRVRYKSSNAIRELEDLSHASYFIAKCLEIKFDYNDIKKYIFTSRKKIKMIEKLKDKPIEEIVDIIEKLNKTIENLKHENKTIGFYKNLNDDLSTKLAEKELENQELVEKLIEFQEQF